MKLDDEQKSKLGKIIIIVCFFIILIVSLSQKDEDKIWEAFFYTTICTLPVMFVGVHFISSTKDFQANVEREYREKSVGNCPHCGSYKTYKISTIGKVASVEMLGLASSTIGKQYGCHNCGHKW